MRNLTLLIRRNLALFQNNKMNILLTFSSIPVVLGLYVLFLRDFLLTLITQTGMNPALVREFTDRMMFSGLLIVINTTTCFGIMQICVHDSETGIKRDYFTAPVSPFMLLCSYWITGTILSFVFTCSASIFGELFLRIKYDSSFMPISSFPIYFILLFSSCMNSGILLVFAKSLKSTTTFSTFANLYGTLIGFFAGAYLPISFYPEQLKTILMYFPPAQLTSLLRQQFISGILPAAQKNTAAPKMELLLQNFGIHMTASNKTLSSEIQWSILIIALAILLFIIRTDHLIGRKSL